MKERTKQVLSAIAGAIVVGGVAGGYAYDQGTEVHASEAARLQESLDAYDGVTPEQIARISSMASQATADLIELQSENSALMADLEKFKAENADLSSELETVKLDLSKEKTLTAGPYYINTDLLKQKVTSEFNQIDEYEGTDFSHSEMTIEDWEDVSFVVDVDEDGDGTITFDVEINYEDKDDDEEYDATYEVTLELKDGQVDEVDFVEV
jgi:hypothetical protein